MSMSSTPQVSLLQSVWGAITGRHLSYGDNAHSIASYDPGNTGTVNVELEDVPSSVHEQPLRITAHSGPDTSGSVHYHINRSDGSIDDVGGRAVANFPTRVATSGWKVPAGSRPSPGVALSNPSAVEPQDGDDTRHDTILSHPQPPRPIRRLNTPDSVRPVGSKRRTSALSLPLLPTNVQAAITKAPSAPPDATSSPPPRVGEASPSSSVYPGSPVPSLPSVPTSSTSPTTSTAPSSPPPVRPFNRHRPTWWNPGENVDSSPRQYWMGSKFRQVARMPFFLFPCIGIACAGYALVWSGKLCPFICPGLGKGTLEDPVYDIRPLPGPVATYWNDQFAPLTSPRSTRTFPGLLDVLPTATAVNDPYGLLDELNGWFSSLNAHWSTTSESTDWRTYDSGLFTTSLTLVPLTASTNVADGAEVTWSPAGTLNDRGPMITSTRPSGVG